MNLQARNIKILIVDDEPEVLRTLKKILEKKGYEVFPFQNPIDALASLKSNKVDLIFTDLKMPEMDGLQFLISAKKILPGAPVSLITAFATIATAVTAIQFGAFDYITKPFDMVKIYSLVERALASSENS